MHRPFWTLTEDYRLKGKTFTHLSALYSIFDIDMFANADNSLCPHYVSRLTDIGSTPSCIDAFFQPHWGTAFYAFPPARRRCLLGISNIIREMGAIGSTNPMAPRKNSTTTQWRPSPNGARLPNDV